MQKHFAVVTGIGMLAVAGIVVSQQAGFFQDSLKGSLSSGEYGSMSSVATSACANPRNCTAGPVDGTCDEMTCQQEFNTGMCKPGTSACATYWSTCADTSRCAAVSSSVGFGCSYCPNACDSTTPSGVSCCDLSTNSCDVGTAISSSASSATMCTGAGEIHCGGGICCSTNDGYCDAGACIPYSSSSLASSENPQSSSLPNSSSSTASCSDKTNSVTVHGYYTHKLKDVASAQALAQAQQACNSALADVASCDEGCTGTNVTRSFSKTTSTCSFVKGTGHTCIVEGNCTFTRACSKS